MTADERIELLQSLFLGALDLAPSEREGHLLRECGGHSSLFREASALLAEHEEADRDGFLAPPSLSEEGAGAGIARGTRLDDFEIVELIGRGGMSVVYRAWQHGLNRVVALKLMLDGALASPASRARFRSEADAVARCQHPSIIQVFAAGEYQGRPYLALEYAERGNLAQRLAGLPQPPSWSAALVRSLAEAVESAHRRGIIHRDLKPTNVLLDGDDAPKVGDFGLAKDLAADADRTHTGELLGTPSYMAPEQVAGDRRRIGPRADVYSLGAILYEALTGRPPFSGVTKIEILDQVREADPVPPRRLIPGIPRDLETVCLKCLHKDPDRRYASAGALADDLRCYLAGLPIRARSAGPWERAVKWGRRHPGARVLILALAALLAGGAFGGRWLGRRLREAEARTTARTMVASLGSLRTEGVPGLVERLAPFRAYADPLLRADLVRAAPGSDHRLHLQLALLPVDAGQVDGLLGAMLGAKPADLVVIRDSLAGHRRALIPRLWSVLDDETAARGRRFRAACALAAYDPSDPRWEAIAREVVVDLAMENPLLADDWARALGGVGERLIPHLIDLIAGGDRAAPDLRMLAGLYDALAVGAPDLFRPIERQLGMRPDPAATESARLLLARQQARIATALLIMGRGEGVWPYLRQADDPTLRTLLIDQLGTSGVAPEVLVARLRNEPDATIRRAIVLALGGYDPERLVISDRQALIRDLLGDYRRDTDAGLHGALHWLLDRWGHTKEVRRIDLEMELAPPAGRDWLVNSQGQNFSILAIPSSPREPGAAAAPPAGGVRRVAMASKEVTVYQFRRFARATPGIAWDDPYSHLCPREDGPALGVLRHEAAAYCNWLSRREGIPESQWCYVPNPEGDPDVPLIPASDFLQRSGYRLPTVEEWTFACRASATTPYAIGLAVELIDEYGWWSANTGEKAHPVGLLKPNDFGLFDLYGNAAERCEDPGGHPPVVQCGGSFLMPSATMILVDRNAWPPQLRGHSVGFRPARSLPIGSGVE